MADIEHKDIQDPQLHEPKGVLTANVNEVYHSDGAGSGSWMLTPTGVGSASNGQVFIADGAGSGSWQNTGGDLHGQMDAVANTTTIALTATPLTTVSNYIRITGVWSAPLGSLNQGITFSTDKLTVSVDGAYRIEFWGSFTTPNNSITGFKFGVNQPATSPTVLSVNTMKRTSGASVAYGVAAAHTIIDLLSGDELSLYVASDTTGNLLLEDSVLMLQLVHEN